MKRACGALIVVVVIGGCGEVPLLEELSPERSCRQTVALGSWYSGSWVRDDALGASTADTLPPAPVDTPAVEWQVPQDDAQRDQLDAWCAAVGPAVLGGFGSPPAGPVDSVAVVSWNVHVGGGDLLPLIDDLRSGRLTGGGGRVEHFVLLLQEAYREGDLVPDYRPGLGSGGAVDAVPTAGLRRGIVQDAEALGLYVYYAPSMRSGEGPEDRGNAILSTLPLRDPLAIELPVARQRRAAVSATVGAVTSDGEPWELQVTSVHLENDARGWANDERARLIQGRALLEALPDAEAAVAAGDFNTWRDARNEAVIAIMRDAFPDTPGFPPGPTYVRAFGILRKYLDYMFFRLPDDATGRYARATHSYNSDHFPLVGWVKP